MKRIMFYISLLFLSHCGSSSLESNLIELGAALRQDSPALIFASLQPDVDVQPDDVQEHEMRSTSVGLALGQEFPADIDIPDLPGMRSTAFVTLTSPYHIVAIDLDSPTLNASSQFRGFDGLQNNLPIGSAISTEFISHTQAFILTNQSLIYFNPTTGQVRQTIDLTTSIALREPLALSSPQNLDSDPDLEQSITGNFSPSFASDLVIYENKIYVSFSNFFFFQDGTHYRVQSIVKVFEFTDDTLSAIQTSEPDYFRLSGFNATGLIATENDFLIAVNSGHYDFQSNPLTPAIIDKVDLRNLANGDLNILINDSLNLGLDTLAIKKPTLQEETQIAFIGSAIQKRFYAFNIENLNLVEASDLPGPSGNRQFITSVAISPSQDFLVFSSFNEDSIYGLDLNQGQFLDHLLDFGIPENPGATGVGATAFRPGVAGVDFTGPDLWILQGIPGILRGVYIQ